MKKLTKALSVVLAASFLSVPLSANSISLRIDNKLVMPIVAPFEQNGTTLVPLRIVSEQLGAKVEWNQKAQAINIIQEGATIILTVGSKVAQVNGVEKILTLAPQVKNNTTMVPIRFVSENLNCTVNWDKENQTVSVNSKDVEYIESKGEKVTTFQNPKIINGVIYLTQAQLEDAFSVIVEKVSNDSATITRKDFHCWLKSKNYVSNKGSIAGDRGNRINWAYKPLSSKGDDLFIKENGIAYFPVKYLAAHLNSTISYSAADKLLTVSNNGIKYYDKYNDSVETVDIKGHVSLPDGSSASSGIVVYLRPNGTIVQKDFLYTETDSEGNYCFNNLKVSDFKTINISVSSHNTKTYKIETHTYKGGTEDYLTEGCSYALKDSAMEISPYDKKAFDIELYNSDSN